MARWRNPYGSCPVCGEVLDNCQPLFANYAAGGKWTARHKTPCPPD